MTPKQAHAAERLIEEGIEFDIAKNGAQFIVDPRGKRALFWPATGAVFTRPGIGHTEIKPQGVEQLIKYIKE